MAASDRKPAFEPAHRESDKEMNWEAISTIAETVSATAVVVSLIYLAAQIRQNNRQVDEQIRALRLQAYDTAGADFSTLRLHVSGNRQRASVWRRAKDSYSALEPDEKSQANEMLHELMWAYQNIFSRMHGGAEDELLRKDEFEALVHSVCSRIEHEDS